MAASKKPDWKEIALAYEEAAEHLDMAAGEMHSEEDAEQKAAFKLVADRIRAAGNRVKPPRTAPRNGY